MADSQVRKIRIGISSCLLGAEVRFDGSHKRDAFINGTLSQYFEFVPVCPEVAIGLGTPRQPIRLTKGAEGTRVRGVKDPSLDVTEPLYRYGCEMAEQLVDICGYIFKRASPSCGMERVKVYTDKGMPAEREAGMYARAFAEKRPLLPMEEEGRLGDPVLRENFIERVFVLARWQGVVEDGLTPGSLVAFHARHKLQIMSHNQSAYRRLGRMVAEAGLHDLEVLAQAYIALLMDTLKTKATRKSNTNVLQHLMGYLKNKIDADDKQELLEIVERYRQGSVPLIVPLTLLQHHFRRHPHRYVEDQHYLEPHPAELMLRNHI